MKQKEKDSLASLLVHTKEIFKYISGQVHWSSDDEERLDDLMHGRGLLTEIGNRLLRATRSRGLTEYVYSFLTYKAWQRTKAVYSFNREFVEDMSQTEDSCIYTSLLERLPFKDMLFYFPENVLPLVETEEIAGIYVHVENHPENLWITLSSLNRTIETPSQILPGVVIGFPITNGMKISQVFETSEYLEWLAAFKRSLSFNQELSDHLIAVQAELQKKIMCTTINLLYYLSSKNADIQPIKPHKKSHKTSAEKKADSAPAVILHEVGGKYPEIVYRKLKEARQTEEDADSTEDSEESNEDTETKPAKARQKRRPHARRAHWQHYWTGEGRTNLEARWKTDIFVGANREDQAVFVYDIEKESSKGKRNPNTSKKKRNKK